MEKVIGLGEVCGNGYVHEFSELNEYLENGWHIVEMQAVSTNEQTTCYVWIKKDTEQ